MSTQTTEAANPSLSLFTLPPPLLKLTRERALLVLVFVFAVGLMLFYRPFSQIEGGDPAIYDYIAQSILRGQIPYRDVVDIKGPASVYLSAAALAVGRLVGLSDVIAIRVFHVLMVGLLAALTFRVGVVYLRSRVIGVMAALLPFVSPAVAEMLISGTQPKLPMVIFGLAALLLIARDRPFWAGFCGMMACLCWQPGLMFVGTAFLIFSRFLTTWRDLRAVKVVAGAVVPLVVVVVYFTLAGALSDLWSYAMVYNYSVFGPEARKPVADAGSHLWVIIRRTFEARTLFLLVALGGFVIYTITRSIEKARRGWSDDWWRDAIIFPALVYLVFAFINFQAEPDLIPFLPFVGLFAGWMFAKAGEWLAALAPRRFARIKPQLESLVPLAALALVVALVVWPALRYRVGNATLQKQIEEVNSIAALLQPDDAVYSHGTIGMLVLMNRPNMNPYVFLDWDMDTFIVARKYNGSFQALIDEMEARKPKLVGMSRLRAVTHGPEFERWVAEHYQELPLRTNKGVYIRKPE